jgi:putative pyruvate formate lyase activating enzyme
MFENLVKPKCNLCPRECLVDRDKHKGLCRTNNTIEIASYNLHFGEEPPISGTNGSGTIFFAGCNLSCIYCQNYPISQLKNSYSTISIFDLAGIMLSLQKRGAHNINLVTPNHFVHLICESIDLAKSKGLFIPIVYNTSSYDKKEVITLLNNYIDIYLADLKYTDNKISKQLSGVSNYFDIAKEAILEMYRTKGQLVVEDGIAKKGLIVRHLMLPNLINNTKQAIEWIYKNLPKVHISLMSQYFPAHKAFKNKIINRKLNCKEYAEITAFLDTLGNVEGFIQEFDDSCN